MTPDERQNAGTDCTCDPGPEGEHWSYCGQTPQEIMEDIAGALRAHDVRAAVALLQVLALADPDSAEIIMFAAARGLGGKP